MLKSYFLKREFFITNHADQIKDHFEFIKVSFNLRRKSAGEPTALSIRPNRRYFPIKPELSKGYQKKKYKTPQLFSTRSK